MRELQAQLAATVGDRDLAVVAVERPEVDLLRALDEFRRHEKPLPEGRREMFHHREVGKIPCHRQDLSGGFEIALGDGVSFFRRLGAGVSVDFDGALGTELHDLDRHFD